MNEKRLTPIYILALIISLVVLTNSACTVSKPENNDPKASTKKGEKDSKAYNTNDSETKTYQKMSEAEQNKFVAQKADEFLQKLGFDKSEKFNAKGLESVKPFVDAYAKRLYSLAKDECGFGDNLSAMLNRGKDVSKVISEEFKSQELPSEAGLYLAMVESEFCLCIQSPTGPLGIFQQTRASGKKYGLEVKRDASPENPDERCELKPAALAAAKNVKSDVKESDSKPLSLAMAIGRYEFGDLFKGVEMTDEMKKSPNSQDNFWLLVENNKDDKNLKYLPKFVAAGIVGENPKVFGVDISPLSQVK